MKDSARLRLCVVVSVPAASTNLDLLHRSDRHQVSSLPGSSSRNLQKKPYSTHSDSKRHKEKLMIRDDVCMPSSPSFSDQSVNDSVCTEEEMVAVEQLRKLKRRRELHDIEENSCSVNTCGSSVSHCSATQVPLVPVNKKHILAMDSPPSNSCAHGFSKNGKKQQKHMSRRDITTQECASVLNDESYLISMTCDFDERVKPKIRLLSDVYNDTKSSLVQNLSSGFNPAKLQDNNSHNNGINKNVKKTQNR